MINLFKKENNTSQEQSGLINLSTQNKLIILGWFLSSILIFFTAWFVINNTQRKIFDSYYNFGLMVTKALAVESADVITGLPKNQQYDNLKNYAASITKGNKDISYIIFRDVKGGIIYSSKSTTTKSAKNKLLKAIEISVPIISKNTISEEVVGSVQVGFTGSTMTMIGKTTRNSMIIIFSVVWVISILAVLINTLLITRQITLLVDGVKRISTGEFGYKIPSKDLWGEIKQLFDAFNDMSARLHAYEEKNIDQLTYERNKLESVLMSIANGVVVCDNYDKIVLANNAALKMLGTNPKEIISTKILDYCDGDGKFCFKEQINLFKETPLEEMELKPLYSNIHIENKTIQTIISPTFTLNQEYLGYIVVLHDITKEAEIDKLKDAFISNVSHELRTPVTVLRSYIDTLHNFGEEFDEATKQEFITIMNQEADRLNHMVNDILDFSRLESPNINLEKNICDIGPILELTVKSMKVLAEEKKLSFSIIIEPDLPQISVNPESIERVMKNLLSNAIKYSNPGGRVKIKAEIDRTGSNLQVTVEDNGIGIPEQHINKIFDRFYRVETKTHAIKGTGLGLHLVKIAIEKHHGGEVFVESKINEGSTFGFIIPLQSDEIKV